MSSISPAASPPRPDHSKSSTKWPLTDPRMAQGAAASRGTSTSTVLTWQQHVVIAADHDQQESTSQTIKRNDNRTIGRSIIPSDPRSSTSHASQVVSSPRNTEGPSTETSKPLKKGKHTTGTPSRPLVYDHTSSSSRARSSTATGASTSRHTSTRTTTTTSSSAATKDEASTTKTVSARTERSSNAESSRWPSYEPDVVRQETDAQTLKEAMATHMPPPRSPGSSLNQIQAPSGAISPINMSDYSMVSNVNISSSRGPTLVSSMHPEAFGAAKEAATSASSSRSISPSMTLHTSPSTAPPKSATPGNHSEKLAAARAGSIQGHQLVMSPATEEFRSPTSQAPQRANSNPPTPNTEDLLQLYMPSTSISATQPILRTPDMRPPIPSSPLPLVNADDRRYPLNPKAIAPYNSHRTSPRAQSREADHINDSRFAVASSGNVNDSGSRGDSNIAPPRGFQVANEQTLDVIARYTKSRASRVEAALERIRAASQRQLRLRFFLSWRGYRWLRALHGRWRDTDAAIDVQSPVSPISQAQPTKVAVNNESSTPKEVASSSKKEPAANQKSKPNGPPEQSHWYYTLASDERSQTAAAVPLPMARGSTVRSEKVPATRTKIEADSPKLAAVTAQLDSKWSCGRCGKGIGSHVDGLACLSNKANRRVETDADVQRSNSKSIAINASNVGTEVRNEATATTKSDATFDPRSRNAQNVAFPRPQSTGRKVRDFSPTNEPNSYFKPARVHSPTLTNPQGPYLHTEERALMREHAEAHYAHATSGRRRDRNDFARHRSPSDTTKKDRKQSPTTTRTSDRRQRAGTSDQRQRAEVTASSMMKEINQLMKRVMLGEGVVPSGTAFAQRHPEVQVVGSDDSDADIQIEARARGSPPNKGEPYSGRWDRLKRLKEVRQGVVAQPPSIDDKITTFNGVVARTRIRNTNEDQKPHSKASPTRPVATSSPADRDHRSSGYEESSESELEGNFPKVKTFANAATSPIRIHYVDRRADRPSWGSDDKGYGTDEQPVEEMRTGTEAFLPVSIVTTTTTATHNDVVASNSLSQPEPVPEFIVSPQQGAHRPAYVISGSTPSTEKEPTHIHIHLEGDSYRARDVPASATSTSTPPITDPKHAEVPLVAPTVGDLYLEAAELITGRLPAATAPEEFTGDEKSLKKLLKRLLKKFDREEGEMSKEPEEVNKAVHKLISMSKRAESRTTGGKRQNSLDRRHEAKGGISQPRAVLGGPSFAHIPHSEVLLRQQQALATADLLGHAIPLPASRYASPGPPPSIFTPAAQFSRPSTSTSQRRTQSSHTIGKRRITIADDTFAQTPLTTHLSSIHNRTHQHLASKVSNQTGERALQRSSHARQDVVRAHAEVDSSRSLHADERRLKSFLKEMLWRRLPEDRARRDDLEYRSALETCVMALAHHQTIAGGTAL